MRWALWFLSHLWELAAAWILLCLLLWCFFWYTYAVG